MTSTNARHHGELPLTAGRTRSGRDHRRTQFDDHQRAGTRTRCNPEVSAITYEPASRRRSATNPMPSCSRAGASDPRTPCVGKGDVSARRLVDGEGVPRQDGEERVPEPCSTTGRSAPRRRPSAEAGTLAVAPSSRRQHNRPAARQAKALPSRSRQLARRDREGIKVARGPTLMSAVGLRHGHQVTARPKQRSPLT